MREIKFRCWDKWIKRMHTTLSIDFRATCSSERGNIVLMQYTGLKDKNGKEIYEGDIIIQNNNKVDLAQVCWGEFNIRSLETERVIDKSVGWYLKVLSIDPISTLVPFCYDRPINNYWIERLNIKVIGNIYENKDLLKGEQ